MEEKFLWLPTNTASDFMTYAGFQNIFHAALEPKLSLAFSGLPL